MKHLAFGIVLLAVAAGAFVLMQRSDTERSDTLSNAPLAGDAMVAVSTPPSFSEQEQMGKRAFGVACADCHGANAQGRLDIAPPLVHKVYEPSHHGDASFFLAAQNAMGAAAKAV